MADPSPGHEAAPTFVDIVTNFAKHLDGDGDSDPVKRAECMQALVAFGIGTDKCTVLLPPNEVVQKILNFKSPSFSPSYLHLVCAMANVAPAPTREWVVAIIYVTRRLTSDDPAVPLGYERLAPLAKLLVRPEWRAAFCDAKNPDDDSIDTEYWQFVSLLFVDFTVTTTTTAAVHDTKWAHEQLLLPPPGVELKVPLGYDTPLGFLSSVAFPLAKCLPWGKINSKLPLASMIPFVETALLCAQYTELRCISGLLLILSTGSLWCGLTHPGTEGLSVRQLAVRSALFVRIQAALTKIPNKPVTCKDEVRVLTILAVLYAFSAPKTPKDVKISDADVLFVKVVNARLASPPSADMVLTLRDFWRIFTYGTVKPNYGGDTLDQFKKYLVYTRVNQYTDTVMTMLKAVCVETAPFEEVFNSLKDIVPLIVPKLPEDKVPEFVDTILGCTKALDPELRSCKIQQLCKTLRVNVLAMFDVSLKMITPTSLAILTRVTDTMTTNPECFASVRDYINGVPKVIDGVAKRGREVAAETNDKVLMHAIEKFIGAGQRFIAAVETHNPGRVALCPLDRGQPSGEKESAQMTRIMLEHMGHLAPKRKEPEGAGAGAGGVATPAAKRRLLTPKQVEEIKHAIIHAKTIADRTALVARLTGVLF